SIWRRPPRASRCAACWRGEAWWSRLLDLAVLPRPILAIESPRHASRRSTRADPPCEVDSHRGAIAGTKWCASREGNLPHLVRADCAGDTHASFAPPSDGARSSGAPEREEGDAAHANGPAARRGDALRRLRDGVAADLDPHGRHLRQLAGAVSVT